MKNRIFLIAMLLSVLPFLLSGSSFKEAKKSDFIFYCGVISAGCPPGPGGIGGQVYIVLLSDGVDAWIHDLTVDGMSIGYMPYSVVDLGGGQFSINIDYYCPSGGMWHYNGGAFTAPCP
ncbi:hypothetical protein HB364_10900 [Pseudoflavitalea sp. X16]|uniref:hypothetical protein n=1 Tax=Paraflavitalea devenefica TaxID=2716334 RepID=UPI0014213A72|nr:hypothetical protein [Paraflavitalea devenefica]NII25593.1 hypothetical protein [Paraflavitalea devenefica]